MRTCKAIGPALLGQILRAGVVVAEGLDERLNRRWLVVLPSGREKGTGHADRHYGVGKGMSCENPKYGYHLSERDKQF